MEIYFTDTYLQSYDFANYSLSAGKNKYILPVIMVAISRSVWVSEKKGELGHSRPKTSQEQDFNEMKFSLRKVLTCLFLSTSVFS